jgi:hemolysin III
MGEELRMSRTTSANRIATPSGAPSGDHPDHRPDHGLHGVAEAIKPHLRGWLHAGTLPVAVAAGLVLVALGPTVTARVVLGVFALSAVLLFGVSALYHRFSWSGTSLRVLKRLDHANIFLIIAGTYTPFSVLSLSRGQATLLLWLVWGGALAGMAFRLVWTGAPRWLYVPVYIALGWVAVMFTPGFWHGAGPAVFFLILAGGLCHTAGGTIYGRKRPDPSPRWFGYHEVFHALTVAGFACHYAGLSVLVSSR